MGVVYPFNNSNKIVSIKIFMLCWSYAMILMFNASSILFYSGLPYCTYFMFVTIYTIHISYSCSALSVLTLLSHGWWSRSISMIMWQCNIASGLSCYICLCWSLCNHFCRIFKNIKYIWYFLKKVDMSLW